MTNRIAVTHPTLSQFQSKERSGLVVIGIALALLFQAFAVAPSSAQEPGPTAAEEAAALADEHDPEPWPRVLEEDSYLIKIYPPQFDDWDGSQIKAQAAIEIEEKGKEGSTYGVVNFIARTRVDKDARLVVFDEYQSINAMVPAQSELESKLLGILQRRFNDSVRVVALDRVETALAATPGGQRVWRPRSRSGTIRRQSSSPRGRPYWSMSMASRSGGRSSRRNTNGCSTRGR